LQKQWITLNHERQFGTHDEFRMTFSVGGESNVPGTAAKDNAANNAAACKYAWYAKDGAEMLRSCTERLFGKKRGAHNCTKNGMPASASTLELAQLRGHAARDKSQFDEAAPLADCCEMFN
jgi:hypothetical protein